MISGAVKYTVPPMVGAAGDTILTIINNIIKQGFHYEIIKEDFFCLYSSGKL